MAAKHYVFTWNNHTDLIVAQLQVFFSDQTIFQYAIFGEERGDLTATPHLQGYFQLVKK